MARYLSYEEYLARGGKLAEGEFEACAPRAEARVDALTYGRARGMAEAPEAVKQAMMIAVAAASNAGAEAMAASPGLTGFTADGYSERYQDAGQRWDAVNRAANQEIRAVLAGACDDAGTPLTYAGGLG